MKLSKSVYENLVFVVVAITAFTFEPAILCAEVSYNPINFTEPLNLSRGNLTATYPGAVYLDHKESCKAAVVEWGWEQETCNHIEFLVLGISPDIDSVLIYKPNSDGYITFDDWEEEKDNGKIEEIWSSYEEGVKQQSKKLGVSVILDKWYVYPTLDKEKKFLYYAILANWDGIPTLNIDAILFDRRGYIEFSIVPLTSHPSKQEIDDMVSNTILSYRPNKTESYLDFSEGDKVAAVGAMGVLASLLGVKYGKGFFAAATAILLLLLKKAWFVLLIPIVFIGKLFKRK